MRKIYTVVFALMVLLSVTMGAMAAPEAPTPAPGEITVTVLLIAPAPAPDAIIPDAKAPAPSITETSIVVN